VHASTVHVNGIDVIGVLVNVVVVGVVVIVGVGVGVGVGAVGVVDAVLIVSVEGNMLAVSTMLPSSDGA
jgi:hypothetical protein